MTAELAKPAWELPPLEPAELGPYGDFPRLPDQAKTEIWDAYRAGRPSRVPVTLGMNDRIYLLDPRFNAEGLDYRRVFNDPAAMLTATLMYHYVCRRRHHLFADSPTGLPEEWEIGIGFQNVYEAASFGAPIEYRDDNVPDTAPILGGDRRHAIFDLDIDRPLERGFFKHALDMCARVAELAQGRTFFGRPIKVVPFTALGTDGPLTVAMNLRGPAILADLRRDPQYARQLFDFLITAAFKRRAAFLKHWGQEDTGQVGIADDSIALLSPAQYREHILPHHRRWFDTLDPRRDRVRGIHLCGDATRHFKTIRDELGVTIFDTGFPVDFAALRRDLGPDVEIIGGVEVPLLMDSTPQRVYERAREILTSGVLSGGHFTLREANNLPPGAAWPNLAAMYKAAFDCGTFSSG
jgi:hypothetical protein